MNIPGFQLGRETEVGEFCAVYSALELESSSTVSIRFFHQQLSSNPEFCQHVKKSSELLLNKVIGNITPIKQAVSDPAGCYIISEYVPCSQNEQPLLTEFTLDEVLNFGLQLAESLSQLHALGLVHGGVCRSNLLYPNFSQVTLGPSFFQRTFYQQNTDASLPISLEEAAYIAPEFSSGLNASADFYSLGVVLFELLFKTKPFMATNHQQLQLLKDNMQFTIPETLAAKLTPLFSKLLAAKPDERIKNAEEYIKAVNQCGFKFDSSDSFQADIQKITTVAEKKVKKKRQNNNILLYSAVAGLLMIAVLTYLTITNPPVEPYKGVNRQPTPTPAESVSTTIQQDPVAIKSPDSDQIANFLFAKSEQQILQNNYGAALMSINNALKEKPEFQAAKKLKRKIELEFEVRAYLSRAEKLIAQRNFTLPENDNAFATYTKLATLLPPGDDRAIKGLHQIANRYYQLANDLVLKYQFDSASNYITTGLTVIPDYPPLKQLELYIVQQHNQQLALQQKLETDSLKQQKKTRLRQQKTAEKEQRRQQLLQEQNRLAMLGKERKIKQQQEREKKKLQLQKQRQKINQLISTGRDFLRQNPLTDETLNKALEIHRELSSFPQSDFRIPALFQSIIDSYGDLANIHKEAETPNFTEALSAIEQGLALDRKNTRLLRMKQEINSLIIAEQQKKKQVPIIGTF